MYNGIGLTTPRGSGTNGHVQRNWAIVRKTKDKVNYKSEEGKIDQLNKQPNKEILDHERKRKIEVKCAELNDILEEQGFTTEEITAKVEEYRLMLIGSDTKPPVSQDEFGRINVRETHQIAEAQQEKNAKLREAFGISEFFVEGSSLDPERHAREAEARKAASKVYELVRTPTPEAVTSAVTTKVTETIACVTEKKSKRKRSGSSTKKKKGKKHKRDRSESPKVSKKKEKSKKKKKDKKHKKPEISSSDSDSSDDTDGSSSSEAESKKKRKKKKKKSKSEVKDKHEKKKAPVKRKHQTSESQSDSSPDPPRKSSKNDKQPERVVREIIELDAELPRDVSSRTSRRPEGLTPPPRRRDSPPSSKRQQQQQQLPDRPKDKLSPNSRDQSFSKRNNRSVSRGRVDNRRGRSQPRRTSRSRRLPVGSSVLSPSPPRRRRGVSRSPRRQPPARYSNSRSRSRSRYDRYGTRRRLSPIVSRRRRSGSRRRSRSPRRRDYPSNQSRNRRDRTPRRKSRSRTKSRSRSRRSSLSYSPMRRDPDRYKDILQDEQRKKSTKRRDDDDKRSPKRKSRSVSKTRKTRVVAVPRVSLRSSSEDEAEIIEDETKLAQEDDEERLREIDTLKKLQSGLAAKARESLGKKVLSPTKIKVEKREDGSSLLDIALPNEPPKITQQQVIMDEKSPRKSPIITNRTPESSRSPSPALPLTREEAEIKIRSPSESPPQSTQSIRRSVSPIVQKKKSSPLRILKVFAQRDSKSPSPTVDTNNVISTIKLRSPTESPPRPSKIVIPPKIACNFMKNLTRSDSNSPSTSKKSPTRKKSYSRSRSRSYTRSVSPEKRPISPRNKISSPSSSSKESNKRIRSPSQETLKKKSISPINRDATISPARSKSPKVSTRSKRSRDSRSSSIASKHSTSRSSVADKKGGKKSTSRSPAKVTSRSRSRSRSLSKRSRSRSVSKKSRSRSRSASRNSRDKTKRRSRSRSSSRSSRSSTRHSRRSFSSSSRSSSSGSSRSSRSSSSSSGSSRSRSPSIPRRHGSPSFLDRRRITSARKRPIPYHRPTPSPPSSPSSSTSSRQQSDWSSPSRRSSRSPTRSPSYTR